MANCCCCWHMKPIFLRAVACANLGFPSQYLTDSHIMAGSALMISYQDGSLDSHRNPTNLKPSKFPPLLSTHGSYCFANFLKFWQYAFVNVTTGQAREEEGGAGILWWFIKKNHAASLIRAPIHWCIPPAALDIQGWAELKPRAGNSTQLSHVGGRSSAAWAMPTACWGLPE